METAPVVVSILFAVLSIAVSAYVAARGEAQIVELMRRTKNLKSELDKFDQDWRSVLNKMATSHNEFSKVLDLSNKDMERLRGEILEVKMKIAEYDSKRADAVDKVSVRAVANLHGRR